ncbi:MAG TPA: hypothetical protein VFK36_00795 [Gemmatimonadales bacterium]|nr:hypothetical protein [Gemmatimonadales bacterium]
MTLRDRPSGRRWQGRAAALSMALLALPSFLAAQTTYWNLLGLETGFCVEFLIAPDLLARTPFRGLGAATAAAAGPLSPVVSRVVAGADSLRAWYPSSLCVLQADSSRTGGDTQQHDDRPVTVVVWQVSAPDSSPAPAVLFASENRLRGAADLSSSAEVPALDGTLDVDEVTGERLVTARIDRTQLAWDGEVLSDTVATGDVSASWRLVGIAPYWQVEFHASPSARRRPNGSLRVWGEGLLAEVLLRSPVRWIPEYWTGGSVHFTFTRGL